MIENRFIKLHQLLRKAKYHYYEMHDNIMEDYDYDMMEKEYDEIADHLEIPQEYRVSNFVGFDIRIPMNPFNMINNERTIN